LTLSTVSVLVEALYANAASPVNALLPSP